MPFSSCTGGLLLPFHALAFKCAALKGMRGDLPLHRSSPALRQLLWGVKRLLNLQFCCVKQFQVMSPVLAAAALEAFYQAQDVS